MRAYMKKRRTGKIARLKKSPAKSPVRIPKTQPPYFSQFPTTKDLTDRILEMLKDSGKKADRLCVKYKKDCARLDKRYGPNRYLNPFYRKEVKTLTDTFEKMSERLEIEGKNARDRVYAEFNEKSENFETLNRKSPLQ